MSTAPTTISLRLALVFALLLACASPSWAAPAFVQECHAASGAVTYRDLQGR